VITEVTHQHVGDSAGTVVALPKLSQMMLKDIGRDLGVPLVATGGRLTKADLAALNILCSTQKALSTPTLAAGSTVTAVPDGAATVDVPGPATTPAHPVTATSREKLIGYGGAGAAGIVLALTLFGGKLRNLATGRGIKVPRLRRPQWLRLPQRKPARE